jgi:hypothetical protein
MQVIGDVSPTPLRLDLAQHNLLSIFSSVTVERVNDEQSGFSGPSNRSERLGRVGVDGVGPGRTGSLQILGWYGAACCAPPKSGWGPTQAWVGGVVAGGDCFGAVCSLGLKGSPSAFLGELPRGRWFRVGELGEALRKRGQVTERECF